MGSKWQTTSLKELGVRLIDCDHKTPKAVECGIPYIGIPQMDNGRINFDANPRLISEDDFKHWTRKANPMYGDIILSRRCNSGETVYVPRKSKFALGQNLVLLRPEGERVHPEYLRWAVHGKEWWNEVAKYLNPGAIFESLKCADIPKFKIPEPPISAQIKIAEHLSAISEKIELNQKINQTLEQMAQALFKSWFVDFDPVFDNLLASADFKLENLENQLPDELKQKAQRRLAALNSLENAAEFKASLIALAHELQALSQTQSAVQVSEKAAETPVRASLNANPNILAQHANTHAHFPNEFEHNEQLGWIPKGWSVNNLSKIAKFTSERVNGDDLTFDNYISTDNMRPNRGGITKASKIPEVKTIPGFHPGHILISNIRPYFKKIWLATSSGGRSNDVLGFEALEPKNTGYLFNLLFQDVFFDYMMTTSKGSKMPRGDKKAIMDWMIVIPPDHIQENYSILVKEFYKTIPLKNKEINILTELRDTLLPKLISGELQIPDSANVSDNNI